jgi:hypothetical protein
MAKKKTALIPQKERMALLDRQDAKIPLSDQCKWLGLNRSSVYYRPKKLPEIQLTAMRNLDELCNTP